MSFLFEAIVLQQIFIKKEMEVRDFIDSLNQQQYEEVKVSVICGTIG